MNAKMSAKAPHVSQEIAVLNDALIFQYLRPRSIGKNTAVLSQTAVAFLMRSHLSRCISVDTLLKPASLQKCSGLNSIKIFFQSRIAIIQRV